MRKGRHNKQKKKQAIKQENEQAFRQELEHAIIIEEKKDRFCPKCGLQLVGNSNYCIGCGEIVEPKTETFASDDDADGNGYGNGTINVNKEFNERFRAAQERRHQKKRKRNILEAGGLATTLLISIGVIVGVVCGIMLLKWYFEPKDQTVVLTMEQKVTEFAKVDHIDPPKEKAFVEQLEEKDKSGKNGSSKDKDQNKKQGSDVKEADPEFQKFYGTRTIQAKGDRVLEWTEEQVWNVEKLDPNSVTYVVNRIRYEYQDFEDQAFINLEILQDEKTVTVRITFRNLSLEENVMNLARLGVIDENFVEKSGKKRFISLMRAVKLWKDEGWKEEGEKSRNTVIYLD